MRNFFPTSVLFCVLHSANSQCISRDETRTSELRSCPWFFIDRAWSSKVQYSQKVEFSFFVLLFNILAVQVAKYNMEPGANYSSLAVLLLGGGVGGVLFNWLLLRNALGDFLLFLTPTKNVCRFDQSHLRRCIRHVDNTVWSTELITS